TMTGTGRSPLRRLLLINQARSPRVQDRLDIEIPDVQRILLDEIAAGLDGVSHENREHPVRLETVFDGDLEESPLRRVHRRFPQRFGVHFAEALVTADDEALFCG